MLSPSHKRTAYIALVFSFVLAAGLTYLVFAENESSLLGIYAAIGILFALLLLTFLNRFIPKKLRRWVRKQLKVFYYLDHISHELIPNRVSLIIILLLLVLFAGMGQAQELLLHLAHDPIQPPVFFAVLLILALLSWYSTRLVYMENIEKIKSLKDFAQTNYKHHLTNDNDVNHIRSVFPKLLGLIIILIPTFFILKLYIENVGHAVGLGVITGTFFMFWILTLIVLTLTKVNLYEITDEFLSKHKWALWVVIILLIIVSCIPPILSEMESPDRIPVLYFSGLIVTIFYFLFTSLKLGDQKNSDKGNESSRTLIKLMILAGVIVTAVLFISFNIFPLYLNVNGLTILLAGLTFYSFIAYVLIIFGGKKKAPVLTLIILICCIVSFTLSPRGGLHDVRLTSGSSNFNEDNRVEIDTFIAGWFAKNKAEIDSCVVNGKKFPILFVSAEGGGSRAALWTLLVHDTLESTIPNYYDHIFSMSGASGGNTGNSFYLAFQEIRKPNTDIANQAKNVFEQDFISADIGMLFGRDTWQSMFGMNFWNDRSEILQQKWENTLDTLTDSENNPLRKEFLSFWYDSTQTDMKSGLKFKHPLFLLNTTHIQSGDHATLSAVKLEEFIPQNMDLIKAVYDLTDEHKSVPLSSGTLMNARFPFVCPTGKIPKVGNFVDAGYYDNFGASETRAAIRAVEKYIKKSKSYCRKHFQFIHLAFRNGLPDKKVKAYIAVRPNLRGRINEKYKPYKGVTEPIAPVLGLVNAAFAHPNRELAEIEHVADVSLYFDLKRTEIRTESGDTILPIIPLSRHLSKYAIQSMEACIRSKQNTEMLDLLRSCFAHLE